MPRLDHLAVGLARKEAWEWSPQSSWIEKVYAITKSDTPGYVFVTMTSKNPATKQTERAIQVGWVDVDTFVNWTKADSAGAYYNSHIKGEAASFHPEIREAEVIKIKQRKVEIAQEELAKAQRKAEREAKGK